MDRKDSILTGTRIGEEESATESQTVRTLTVEQGVIREEWKLKGSNQFHRVGGLPAIQEWQQLDQHADLYDSDDFNGGGEKLLISQHWYENGKLHCDNGPAYKQWVAKKNKNKNYKTVWTTVLIEEKWMIHGMLHRSVDVRVHDVALLDANTNRNDDVVRCIVALGSTQTSR